MPPARLTEIIDIGASPVDGPPPYQAMLDAGLCRVTGFEPHEGAFNDLQARKGPNERYLNHAVGDGAAHTLHIHSMQGLTSILSLNEAAPALFPILEPDRLLGTETVATTRLDDLSLPCDLLKIDVQGAELMIFRHGRQTLSRAVAVHTEVSHFPLYHGQPTHGDIDAELRGLGFLPFTPLFLRHWPLRGERELCRQVIDADWLYVRDYTRPDAMSPDQLEHLALICRHVYDAHDLARYCEQLRQRGEFRGHNT